MLQLAVVALGVRLMLPHGGGPAVAASVLRAPHARMRTVSVRYIREEEMQENIEAAALAQGFDVSQVEQGLSGGVV